MFGRSKEAYQPLTETADVFSILTQICAIYPDRSNGIDKLLEIIAKKGAGLTLPCRHITGLGDLEEFLEDKCEYRYYRERGYGERATYYNLDPDGLGVQNMFGGDYDFSRVNAWHLYTSGQAIFIIIHPASGIHSSNGDKPFVSLAHHQFTPYSDLYGPALATPDPLKPQASKRSLPFELITKFDPAYRFYDRSGVLPIQAIGEKSTPEFTVFIDQLSPSPHDNPNPSNKEKQMVFVPLKKDGQTIVDDWQVYAIPNTPVLMTEAAKLLPPFLKVNPAIKNQNENCVSADYVTLETGNPLFDRYFSKVWTASTVITAATVVALAYYAQIKPDTSILENARRMLPYVIGGLCGGSLVWPITSFIWAINRDSKEK